MGFADVTVDLSRRQAVRAGAVLRLSLLEFELLACLLRHPEEGLTRHQLSEGVWSSSSMDGSNFVDVAIMGLRKKLEAGGKPRLIQTLRGYGYVLREGE